MSLRPATATDVADMAAVHAAAFDIPWPEAELAQLLAGPGGFALVVEGDRGLAGFILCRAIVDEAEVLTLAVDPALRRQGAGAALLEAALAVAASRGAVSAFLEVAEDNAAARGLYAGRGFEAVGRRPAYYARPSGSAVDALVMRRALNR